MVIICLILLKKSTCKSKFFLIIRFSDQGKLRRMHGSPFKMDLTVGITEISLAYNYEGLFRYRGVSRVNIIFLWSYEVRNTFVGEKVQLRN